MDQLALFAELSYDLVKAKLVDHTEVPYAQLHKQYWKIFSQLSQPKDELINFIIIVSWFLLHFKLWKLANANERSLYDQRFMFDSYHILIYYINGIMVSDEFVRIQIESYLNQSYLNYRLNHFQKKNLRKVQPLLELKRHDIKSRRRIRKPASVESMVELNQLKTKFNGTIKFNLHQVSPSINDLVSGSSPKPNMISHKLSCPTRNDLKIAKALRSLQTERSTTQQYRVPIKEHNQKILDQYKVTIPPQDYYKKNPKVDHLFKDMLDMKLILQCNPQQMSLQPRVKEDYQTARDRIIQYLDEKKLHEDTVTPLKQSEELLITTHSRRGSVEPSRMKQSIGHDHRKIYLKD